MGIRWRDSAVGDVDDGGMLCGGSAEWDGGAVLDGAGGGLGRL